ncbi:hypothetical protein N007_05200 [Alicyclobacillus acidoterrestris ATCC 49025]|nr:hypothetical protein N007_05200 [Alicyclobacillus acidoterrestris ATCC 49025]
MMGVDIWWTITDVLIADGDRLTVNGLGVVNNATYG